MELVTLKRLQVSNTYRSFLDLLKIKSFSESIGFIEEEISLSFDWIIGGDFKAYLRKIEKLVVAGDLGEDHLLDMYAKYLEGKDARAKEYPLIEACLYLMQAKNEIHLQNTDAAWSCLVQCTLCLKNASKSLRNPALQEWSSDKQIEAGTKGGLAKSLKNSQPAKDKAIELLKEKCPNEGWNKPSTAINAILPDLAKFVTDRRLSLNPETLRVAVNRWQKNDQQFKAAFHAALNRANA